MFGVMLLATTASGLLVLVLRSTVALGPVLLAHLALVGGFFLCLPYSKFVHAAYRYVALVQFHIETRSPQAMVPDTLAQEVDVSPAGRLAEGDGACVTGVCDGGVRAGGA